MMDTFIESLFTAMYEHLKRCSSMLAFVQARVSAESFVRNQCALAASRLLDDEKYQVHMEKRYKGKTIDLLIHEVEKGTKKEDPAYQFELKMAWPRGRGENSAGVRHDLRALQGRENAWVLVLYFAFDRTEPGFPYQSTKIAFEYMLKEFIDKVAAGPPTWTSAAFDMSSGKSAGKACLVAWSPTISAYYAGLSKSKEETRWK